MEYKLYSQGYIHYCGKSKEQAQTYYDRLSQDNTEYLILKEGKKTIQEYKGKGYLFGEKVLNALLNEGEYVKIIKPQLLNACVKVKFTIIEKNDFNEFIVSIRAELNEWYCTRQCSINDTKTERFSNEDKEKLDMGSATTLVRSFKALMINVMNVITKKTEEEMFNEE